jgi:menaquinone-dependent protoporphyrinogen IX oxidase
MKALVAYLPSTGNTKKIAEAICPCHTKRRQES